MTLMVRATGDPEALEATIRQTVHTIDPLIPVPKFTTMDQILGETVAPRRFLFVLLGAFAFLAGTLAAVGLYGVLAHFVADRTREIGIRVALGADVAQVRRLVVGQGMALATTGVVLGVTGALLTARLLEGMVYQASVYDTRTLLTSAATLLVVAYLASLIPAWRAGAVDPMVILKSD
jgi:ABC-type antimicrobial peptide transport system permease subunit